MEETNAIFGGFDRDGGDECKSNLGGSAAFARDVKPGSDVHSILPNQRSPLENKGYHIVNILQLTLYMIVSLLPVWRSVRGVPMNPLGQDPRTLSTS